MSNKDHLGEDGCVNCPSIYKSAQWKGVPGKAAHPTCARSNSLFAGGESLSALSQVRSFLAKVDCNQLMGEMAKERGMSANGDRMGSELLRTSNPPQEWSRGIRKHL